MKSTLPSTTIALTDPTSTRGAPIDEPSPSDELKESRAWMVSLSSGRIVIIRRDDAHRIWHVDQLCRPVDQLCRGDRVYYKSQPDRVCAIRTY